jgi:stress response protein YsnF
MKFILYIIIFFEVSHAAETISHIKSLESYPHNDVLWLASMAGNVAVNPSTKLSSLRSGEIKWNVSDGEAIVKGVSLAVCGAAQIAQSERQFTLNESKLPLDLQEAELNHQEKTATLEKQLDNLHYQCEKLNLSKNEVHALGAKVAARVADEKLKILSQIQRHEEIIEQHLGAESLRVKQDQLRLDLEKIRLEHLENVRNFEIIAPHDGILHIEQSGYVRGNDIIGSIENRGIATVTLHIADPEILNEKPELLEVSVEDARGNTHIGTFSHIEKGANMRMGFVIYHFNLVSDTEKTLPIDLNGERMVMLRRKLGCKAYIVPKVEFLFHNTEEIQRIGWSAFVSQCWPASKIFLLGPRSIAIIREK